LSASSPIYVCTSDAETIPTISSAPALVVSIRGLAGPDAITSGNAIPVALRLALVVLFSEAERRDPLPDACVWGEEYAEVVRDVVIEDGFASSVRIVTGVTC
jgi:hypothetical protein